MLNHAIKSKRLKIIPAACWLVYFFLTYQATAATTIVGVAVNNGDFNDDVSATDSRPFNVTTPWWNLGSGNQTEEATRTNQTYDGSRNAVIFSGTSRIHSMNTGYDILEGDVFSVRYVWRDGFQWDHASDRIYVRLYVTANNLIGGTPTTLAEFMSGYSTLSNTYESVSGVSPAASASFAGKRLFVLIDVNDGNADGNDFARLDNLWIVANQSVDLTAIGGSVRNGNFNDDTSSTDSRNFSQTPFWSNIGSGGDTAEATRTNQTFNGTRMAIIASTSARIHAQNTQHDLQQGDVVQVSYVWKDGLNFDHAHDQVIVKLYVTSDGLIGGPQTVLASLPSGPSQYNDSYQYAYGISMPADASFSGKRLFVSIDIQDGNGDANDFARLDDFNLVVNPNQLLIPTLGEWGMIALFGLVAIVGGRKIYRRSAATPRLS